MPVWYICPCVLLCVCSCSQLPAHSSITISAVFWAQGGTKCHSLPVNYVAILPPPYAWGLSPIRRHRNHRSMHGNTMEDQIKTLVRQLKWADVPVLIKALADKFTAGVTDGQPVRSSTRRWLVDVRRLGWTQSEGWSSTRSITRRRTGRCVQYTHTYSIHTQCAHT